MSIEIVGEHELIWDVCRLDNAYYGCLNLISDQRRCVKCGRTWAYGWNDTDIKAIPCIPDDPRAVATVQEVEKIKREMKSILARLYMIQRDCPHKWLRNGLAQDINGNTFTEFCRVCGLERRKGESWEEALRVQSAANP